jgi:hypothetical protein
MTVLELPVDELEDWRRELITWRYAEKEERGEGGRSVFSRVGGYPVLYPYISVSLNFLFTDVLRFWIPKGRVLRLSCSFFFSFLLSCWCWAKPWVTFCPCCMYIYQALLLPKIPLLGWR